jgi:hypothetical protein
LHSRATEQEKDKKWVQKINLQRIWTTQDEFSIKGMEFKDRPQVILVLKGALPKWPRDFL